MAKNHFADMFRISQESADSTATELPVVLKVAVEPAEGGADVAQDPAVAPAADAPAAADAGSADTNVENGSTPVAPVDTPAVSATTPQPVETVPVADDDDENQTIADVEQQMIAANSEEGLAETSNEIDNINQDMEVAEDAVAEAKDQMEVQEEILKNPETVTPASVAIAVQNFKAILKRVGMDESVAPSIQHVSFESMLSKENGGLGSSPAAALRIVHEDMGKFVSGAKNAMVKLWEAIKAAFAKVVEFVKNIFFNIKKQGQSLIEQIKKDYPDAPDGKFKPYTVFPALKVVASLQGNIANVKKYNEHVATQFININNKFVTLFNNKQKDSANINPSELIEEMGANEKFLQIEKIDGEEVLLCGKDYYVSVNSKTVAITTTKLEEIQDEVQLPSKNELINGLNAVVSYDITTVTKKMNEVIGQSANLSEEVNKDSEVLQSIAKGANEFIRAFYGRLVKEVTKANVSINKGALEYATLAIKAASGTGKSEEKEQLENK